MTCPLTTVLTKNSSNDTWGEYFPFATARNTAFDVISSQKFKDKCNSGYEAYMTFTKNRAFVIVSECDLMQKTETPRSKLFN